MENNLYKTKLWKRILSVILAVIIGFGTFVTMTFSNVLLSDYVDLKSMFTANAATLNLVPLYYRHGELIGLYKVDYSDKRKLQYKIGENGKWTNYSVPFAIPAHKTTKVYTRIGETGKIAYYNLSNTNKALGVYTESNTDFSFSYNGIDFGYTRIYNSADKNWFESIHSKVLVTDSRLEVTLPDGSKYPMIRKDSTTYVDELNGYTLTKTNNNYIFDDGTYKYYFAIKVLNSVAYLSAIEDNNGNKLNLNRTTNSNEISISDASGRKFSLSDYQAINAPDGSDVKYYSQKEITDPNGNKLKYTTKQDKYIEIKDQAGVILGKYEYTNNTTDFTLVKSNDNKIEYYSNGRLKQITYKNGSWIKYTYNDASMNYTTLTSSGETTKTVYNDAFLPVEYTDESGTKTEYTYDNHYRVKTEKSGDETTTYTYDSKGNVISYVTSNEKNNTYYTYNSAGKVIREQTGNDYTYYTYDAKGNNLVLATLKKDYQGEAPALYDSSLTCFDTTTYTYDSKGRVTKEENSDGSSVSYEYDASGNVTKETNVTVENDKTKTTVTTYTYDDMGNLLKSKCDEDNTSYIYDEAGRILLANENGESTRILYDDYGRTVQEIEPEYYNSEKDGLPNNNTYEDTNVGYIYTYSENGNLENITNDIGIVTTYAYNAVGERIRESFDIYEFNYGDQGEILNIKVAGEIKISYTYDEKNRLLTENYANGDLIRYEYNDIGELSARYRNNNKKPYVTYSYDSDGKLKQIINTDNGLKTVYNENGAITVYKLSDNSTIYSYSESSNESNINTNFDVVLDIDENHYGRNYKYTVNNSINYISSSTNIKHNSLFDEYNRKISDKIEMNNNDFINSSYTYDNTGKLLKKNLSYGDNSIEMLNKRNESGQIVSTSCKKTKNQYTYDDKNQLISSNKNQNISKYVYDDCGNIKTKVVNNDISTFSYSNNLWSDLLIDVNGTKLSYDDNGNVLTYGNKSYKWENGRQLASIKDKENVYCYSYDDQGYRTSKTVNGKTTYYNTKYGTILSQLTDDKFMYFQYDDLGNPIGFIYNDTQYFYTTNQFGDIIGIVNAAGDKIASYEYDEWGQIISISSTSNKSEKIAKINPLRYRGYYYDTETGYYYLQSRYYDPSICRFINADDIMMAKCHKYENAGLNLFTYCCNNPIENSDPSGYWKKDDHYSWTKSWIQSRKRGTVYDKIRSNADTIANQCRNLDNEYPSTAYAKSGCTDSAKKSWQYFHFNGNKTGTDSRIKYSNDMMTNALSTYKVNKNKGLMYLGYGLHAIQDIEAHGQIGRGNNVPAHGATADNPNYEWKDSSHTTLKKASGKAQPRVSTTCTSSLNYLKRFCNAI